MTEPTWRNAISKIDPYIPGKSIEDVKKNYHLEKVIRMASNENQFGPSPKAVSAASKAMQNIMLYPDSTAEILRDVLGKHYKVSPDEIMTANGADEILSLLISAYVNASDEVIYCTPTFPSYRTSVLLMEGIPVEVPMQSGWRYDLEKILQKVTEKTKMIFICNPNNPTGTKVSQEEMISFLDKVPDHVQVVLDEAYIEYVEPSQNYPTGIDYYKKNYPVVTVRTFSKYYGLAGLRVGYVVASKSKLAPLLRIRPPFANNQGGIEAAVQALLDQEYSSRHLQKIKEGKIYLSEELTNLGCKVTPSDTNFLFVDLKENALSLFEQLMSKGFIIRPCTPWGFPEHARITIGTKEQNISFIKALNSIKNSKQLNKQY